MQSVLGDGLERLFYVDRLLCGRLKVRNVALGLAPGHRAFLGDLSLILLHIDLVTQHDEGEVLRVPGASLDEEFVPPTVQSLERLGAVNVVNEYATVRATIERDTEGLESLLTGSIPQLSITGNILDPCILGRPRSLWSQDPYLHGNQPVVHHDFLCQTRELFGISEPGTRHQVGQRTNKSAPMVALYWLLNLLFTYWFMSEVFPTLVSEHQPLEEHKEAKGNELTHCRPK